MAKIILSDQNLGQFACKEFKQTCDDINSDNLLVEGCTINEILDDYWLKQKCFEVVQEKQKVSNFDKDKITFKKKDSNQ